MFCASCAPKKLYHLDIVCDDRYGCFPAGSQIYFIGDYHEGEVISNLIVRPLPGWILKEWVIYSTDSSEVLGIIEREYATLIMPACDVTLVAVFTEVEQESTQGLQIENLGTRYAHD